MINKKNAFTLAESSTHAALSQTKVKSAFTLSEILITLGIIGVVAALTIPNLIYDYKAKQLRSKFFRTYSVIQQVFKDMEAEGDSGDPFTYPSATFYKTFGQYLTGATDCKNKSAKENCYKHSNHGEKNTEPFQVQHLMAVMDILTKDNCCYKTERFYYLNNGMEVKTAITALLQQI